MVKLEDYGDYETAWCPGCGNFKLLDAVKAALVKLELEPRNVLFVSGIGQAAKAPHYLNANVFNGLHGRSLPAATGAKLANPNLTVIAESGDGCHYGEGGNHFISAIRRNVDITVLAHDNQIYALTKGQVSPTSDQGSVTKTQPRGPTSIPFNPLAVAIVTGANFVARGFVGEPEHLADLIAGAIAHRGLALVDILQNCVSFNKINTLAWYKERVYKVEGHDPEDRGRALELAMQWGDKIPIGVIYKNNREPFHSRFAALEKGPLAGSGVDKAALREIMESYA